MNYFAHSSVMIDENVEICRDCNAIFSDILRAVGLGNRDVCTGIEFAHSVCNAPW